MFWTCENHAPDDLFWEPGFHNLIRATEYLFNNLLESLKKKQLPHYFIPEINILEKTPQDIVGLPITKISSMVQDLSGLFAGQYCFHSNH